MSKTDETNGTSQATETNQKVQQMVEGMQALAEVIRPLEKLLRDERMGTRGPDHDREKERAEAAYRQFKADNATPLERYAEAMTTSTHFRQQIRPSRRRVPFRPALSPRW